MRFRPGRLVRLLGVALVIGIPASQALQYAVNFDPVDMSSYLWAGEAWRTTANPYTPADIVVDGNPIYRYAPWFAIPWIGLSQLPIELVEVLWAAAMVACAVLAVVPVLRAWGPAAIPVAGFFGGWLVAVGLNGNVQPALIALLAWGVERRWGPAAIAVAASLKAVPLLYVIVYAGRGEWTRVAWTLFLTAVLVVPMLLFDIPALSLAAGDSYSLFSVSPVLWGTVAMACAVAAFALARSRYAWPAAGLAVVLALPRAWVYDITFLLPGLSERRVAEPAAPAPVPAPETGG
jgi:hypothetical protein